MKNGATLQPKIACPYCGSGRSKVKNSRPGSRKDGIWRRRECVDCQRRFTTEETLRGHYDKTT